MKKLILCIWLFVLSYAVFSQDYTQADGKIIIPKKEKLPYNEMRNTKLIQGITLTLTSAGFAAIQYMADKHNLYGKGDINPYIMSAMGATFGVGILLSIPSKKKYQLKQ